MGASAGDIRAGGAFVEVNADTDKAKKNLTGFGSALADLKKKFGEESQFGGLFKILAGTGAVAGIGLAARLLGDLTSKAVSLKGEFDSGAKSAGDVTEELWQAVPVLGDIRKIGLDIRELWKGEAADIAKMTAEAEKANASVEARRKLIEESNKAWERQRDVLAGLAGQMELIGRRGMDAQVQAARNASAQRERGFQKSAADDIAAMTAAAAKDPTGKAAADLPKKTAQRQAVLTSEISQNAILLNDEINKLYAAEADRMREVNRESEDRVAGINAETAALKAQTIASMAMSDADAAQIKRVQEFDEIELELKNKVAEATRRAQEEVSKLGAGQEEQARRRMSDLDAEIAALNNLANAEQEASAARGARSQLDAIFNPIEDTYDNVKKSLDDFFGSIEADYERMREGMMDHISTTRASGTFSGIEAANGLGNAMNQTATNTAGILRVLKGGQKNYPTYT